MKMHRNYSMKWMGSKSARLSLVTEPVVFRRWYSRWLPSALFWERLSATRCRVKLPYQTVRLAAPGGGTRAFGKAEKGEVGEKDHRQVAIRPPGLNGPRRSQRASLGIPSGAAGGALAGQLDLGGGDGDGVVDYAEPVGFAIEIVLNLFQIALQRLRVAVAEDVPSRLPSRLSWNTSGRFSTYSVTRLQLGVWT